MVYNCTNNLKTKTMKKTIIISAISLLFPFGKAGMGFAQNVGINAVGIVPNGGAGLDVNYSDKGMLIPRVSLSDVSVYNPPITGGGSSKPTSMLVYNTNTAVVGGNGEGFYYWDSVATKWKYRAAPANGPGSPGQVLTSKGPNNPPQWSTLSVSGGGGTTGCANCITEISSPTTNVTWIQCANYCNSLGGGWRMPTWDEAIYYRTSLNITSPPGGWQSIYIWTSTPCDARFAGGPASGTWFVFLESSGNWNIDAYNINLNGCRCVR
jgi:hypothetical protein